MPAPLAKGPGTHHRSSSPHSHPPSRRPNHPLATGLIIAASVLVAAGIAIYESPQVRQWVDQSRRKIAVALHSLGDEIQPRRPSETSSDYEERKKRREELVRRNRNELIRRAREEGVAVDLDELAKIGAEDIEMAEGRQHGRKASQRSFDDLVGSDGMLRRGDAKTTAKDNRDFGLRKRGGAYFAAGSAAGAVANPFSDDHVLFDRDSHSVDEDDEEAPSPKPFTYTEPGTATRESSATLPADPVSPPPAAQLIDLTPDSIYLHPENPQTASIPHSSAPSVADEEDPQAQSFYSFTSSASQPQVFDLPPADAPEFEHDEPEHVSTGTLTPRSEHSAFTFASDLNSMANNNDTDHDARSEIFSEGGFTDAGFSDVGEGAQGIMTPSSWTDVGSDDESEFGGVGAVSQGVNGGFISQVHQ